MIILSLILGIFFLIGTAILFYKFSLKILHILLIFIGLLIFSLFIWNDNLHLIISFIIIGASAGFIFKNSKKLQTFLIISSLLITLISTSNHYYYKFIKNIDILKNSRDKFIALIQENNSSESDKKEIIQKLDDSIKIMADLIPFIYFLNSIILSFICIFLLKYIFIRKISRDENYIDTIEFFKMKEYFIFIYIGAWLIVLLVDKKNYILNIIGLNIALILSCLYILQSFGIMKFLFKKRHIPFSIIPIIILSFVFIGIEYFLFVLIIFSGIGAVDFWADFRKLNLENKKT